MGIEQLVRPVVYQLRQGQHRLVCPSCGRQRKKKSDKTLSVKIEDRSAAFHCWHCQEAGVVQLESSAPVRNFNSGRSIVAVATKKQWSDLTPESEAFLKARGISVETARRLGVKSAQHYIQALGTTTDCVVFPYLNKGQEYAAKIRATQAKGFSSNGAPATLWNLQNFTPGDWLIICEGEMDALTLVEAGYEGATSIPLGAVLKVADGYSPEEDTKFRFVWEAKDQIDKASRIVICCDGDAPGQAASEEIARRIGKDRVWVVDYPEGCKDANDVWLQHGQDGIDRLISECRPWPISGLYDSSHFFDQLDDIFEQGIGRGESTGYPSVDELYSVSAGMLTIVTGHPSSGKSEFVDQIMVNLARSKGWNFAIASFENEPRLHIAKLISKFVRKPFFQGREDRMTPDELTLGKEFVQSHFSFIYQADGSMASLDSILERMKVAVMRHGVRGAVIDPYNYIQKPGDVSETEWVSVMLSKVRLFAQAHGMHIWFVAHPAKMMRNAEGKVPPPKGYDISGCHDAATEVLTSSGWVPHPELNSGHMVAAYDPVTGSLKYEKPQHIHVYDHDGPMHHWNGDSLDIMVTPNHRMVAKRKPEDDYGFTLSSEITSGRWYFPSASDGVAGGDDSVTSGIDLGYHTEDLMWFMGFWVAEGCTQSNSLSVCQAEDQHEVPKSVMDRLGLVYTAKVSDGRYREKRMWAARLHRKWHIDLIDTVIRECREGAANKRVPPMLWAMTRAAKLAFLDGYWFGDGSTRNNSRQAYTISAGLADDIQRLAVEVGYFTSARKDYSTNARWADRHAVTWRDQDYRSIQTDRNLAEVHYTGKVYCVTVSTGAYVTRRNGKVAYQGNSAAWFAKADHGLTIHRPDPIKSVMSEVHSWKSRFSWLGKQGVASLYFSAPTSSYFEPDDDPTALSGVIHDPFADIGPAPNGVEEEDEDEEDVPF